MAMDTVLPLDVQADTVAYYWWLVRVLFDILNLTRTIGLLRQQQT